MDKLTPYEKAFLQQILKTEKHRCETFLEEHENAFESYFVRNETLPFLERMIEKLEV